MGLCSEHFLGQVCRERSVNGSRGYVQLAQNMCVFEKPPFGVFQLPTWLKTRMCKKHDIFFSLIVNEIVEHLSAEGKHGVQLWSGLTELFILLFADDLVLKSSSPAGLRN